MIEPRLVLETQNADGFQQAQSAQSVRIGGVFGGLEAHLHMALGRQVIDFVRLHLLHQADQVGGVGQVAVVQEKPHAGLVQVLVEMVDTPGIEG